MKVRKVRPHKSNRTWRYRRVDSVARNKAAGGHLFRACEDGVTFRALSAATKGTRYDFMGTIYFVGHYFYRGK